MEDALDAETTTEALVPDLEEKARKAAQNQALLRSVNERVVELTSGSALALDEIDLLCECFDLGCAETIRLSIAEYEAIREDGRRFAVRRGHVLPQIERVVEANDRYEVVEKLGEAAEVALGQDPRTGAPE